MTPSFAAPGDTNPSDATVCTCSLVLIFWYSWFSCTISLTFIILSFLRINVFIVMPRTGSHLRTSSLEITQQNSTIRSDWGQIWKWMSKVWASLRLTTWGLELPIFGWFYTTTSTLKREHLRGEINYWQAEKDYLVVNYEKSSTFYQILAHETAEILT